MDDLRSVPHAFSVSYLSGSNSTKQWRAMPNSEFTHEHGERWMTESSGDGRATYPYMSPAQWYGVRARLRQSMPKGIDVDWLMAALGTSEKGARNALPQLRALGLIDTDGKPTSLALDLRDDEHYAQTCDAILEALYPESLLHAYDSSEANADQVARWFMRNAHTGEATAKMQARLYLTLLRRELPSDDQKPRTPRKRAAKKTAPAKNVQSLPETNGGRSTEAGSGNDTSLTDHEERQQAPGPALHIDLQIHISADASDTQIDAVFKSMAKYLYGRE